MAKKAKKKKKSKSTIGGIAVPKPVMKAVWSFLDTPLGREVAAAALTTAATTLVRKHPLAATASVGAGVGAAAKTVGGHAIHAAAQMMHAASDRLRSGFLDEDDDEDEKGGEVRTERDEDGNRIHRLKRADDDGDGKSAGRSKAGAKVYGLEEALFADIGSAKKLKKAARKSGAKA